MDRRNELVLIERLIYEWKNILLVLQLEIYSKYLVGIERILSLLL